MTEPHLPPGEQPDVPAADRADLHRPGPDQPGPDQAGPDQPGSGPDPATRPPRRPAARRILLVGARSTVGLIGVGIAVVTVAAASLLPLPTLGTGATSTVVNPVAATQQRICPGPILRLGDDTGQEATTALTLGSPEVERASTRGTPALENLTPTDNTGNLPSQRLVLPAAAAGEDPGLLAGSQSQYLDAGDDVGFAATDCAAPASESWLVGGSTLTGRTTLLELNNPSKVAALVDLSIYSEAGAVQAAGTDGILVPAGGQRILSLAGFAPGIASPVILVESAGGQVSAHLQESIVRTLEPGGLDILGTTTRPSTTTVIPGIVVADQEAIDAASGLDGYQDIQGALRILIPGDPSDGPSSVTVTVTSEDGTSPTNQATITVDPGKVTDVPLGDFAAGNYTITVTSDQPAVSAIRTSTVTLRPGAGPDAAPTVDATDLGWFVGAPELHDQALVAVAPGPDATLHLSNSTENRCRPHPRDDDDRRQQHPHGRRRRRTRRTGHRRTELPSQRIRHAARVHQLPGRRQARRLRHPTPGTPRPTRDRLPPVRLSRRRHPGVRSGGTAPAPDPTDPSPTVRRQHGTRNPPPSSGGAGHRCGAASPAARSATGTG